MMDGWMARHRGRGWGLKADVEGWDRVNWHEIKSAVIYRLSDQVRLGPRRGALLRKHVVATPARTDPATFGGRVHREALRMGLARAGRVYVVMDGAVWLWNVFEERFASIAEGTLDFFHAGEHLHTLGKALFEDPAEARAWTAGLLHGLRHGGSEAFFGTLAELVAKPPEDDPAAGEAIRQAAGYFENHRDHMEYSAAAEDGLPIGSGSMESQCSQFQDRFKRRGQFWGDDGFAALLEVCLRHQNGEIRSLWTA